MIKLDNLKNLRITICAADNGLNSAHIDKLIPSLKSMGCEITFVGWDRNNDLEKSFAKDGVTYRMIFRGWGYASKILAVALPLWLFRLFLFLLFQKDKSLIMAIDFDAGFPAALAGLFTGRPFVYNIRDNYSMRTTLPRMLRPVIRTLDRWVIRRSLKVIVPDENRITVSEALDREKFVVIYNCAKDYSAEQIEIQNRPFTVYTMGYLVKARGIKLIIDVAKRNKNINVLMAGNIYEDDIKQEIKGIRNIDYRGHLSQEEALKLCFSCDVIFTFYDPVSEINRRAASNKWSDAMMASRPILVNSEVEKSKWIAEKDIGYLCPYGDSEKLEVVLEHIRTHPEEARLKGKNGRRLYDSGYSWPAMEKRLYIMLKAIW